MSDYYNNVVHKMDKRGEMLVVKDVTNDEWDVQEYNSFKLEYVEYNKSNTAVKRYPIFVDADEFNGCLSQILSGNYSKTIGWHEFYGGSKNKGLAQKLEGKDMVPLVNGVESRKLTIGVNKGGWFDFKISIGKGSVGNRGEIKPSGNPVDEVKFSISPKQAVILAKSIDTYVIAKKSLAIRIYTKNKMQKIKEAG